MSVFCNLSRPLRRFVIERREWRAVVTKSGMVLLACILAGCAQPGRQTLHAPAPTLSRTFVLAGARGSRPTAGVPGRIDHMAYDPVTKRLFVAALENGSLEVIDLESGQRIRSVGGLQQPQGIAFVPTLSCAAVACGGDGVLHIYDTRTLEEVHKVEVGPDADNVRYDAKTDRVYVSYGSKTAGAIAILNPSTWTVVRELPFHSRPESFQLDSVNNRVFANLPKGVRATEPGEVAAVSGDEGRMKLLNLKNRARNFPMAFDAAHERLFIASRRPARLIVIDTSHWTVIAEAACTDDSDDLFYDAQTGRVLVIGGGFRPDLQDTPSPCSPPGEMGSLDIFSISSQGKPTRVANTVTAPHVRTGLFIPARRAIYVAVPPRDGRDPEIREYMVD